MTKQLPHKWAMLFFLLTLALTGIFASLLAIGHGSVPSLLLALFTNCITAISAFRFKWAAIIFSGLALILAFIALIVAIYLTAHA